MGLWGALASVALSAGLWGPGCYAEREPPSTFRYACDADGDCSDGETCRGSICERTCSAATAQETCGTKFATCFNGACASTCELGASVCPSVQECVDLSDFGIDFGGGSTAVGICGRMCDDGNALCPDDETCLGGFCAPTCELGSEGGCQEGLVCIPPGVCAPMELGEMTGGEMTGTGMTGTEMTGGASSGSGDAG